MCLKHKYQIVYRDGPRIVRECKKCGRVESTMYDMLYGETYWVQGDWWTNKMREVEDEQKRTET